MPPVQQNFLSVVALTMVALTAAACTASSAAQEPMGRYGGDPMMHPCPTPLPYVTDGYGVVPRPPTRPVQASRPASWPGAPVQRGQRNQSPRYGPGPPQYAAAPPGLELCEGTLILAKVGSEVILACELIGEIDEGISRSQDKASAEEIEAQRERLLDEVQKGIGRLAARGNGRKRPTQTEMEREVLIRQLLKQQIETKLIYYDARQKIPKENFPQIEKNLSKRFDEVALAGMMKQHQVGSRRELDQKLHAMCSSIEKRRRAFLQKTLARGWIREQIKFDEEITNDQMLKYYRGHLDEFETPARVRWEELMVRFSKHPRKSETYAAIAWMGNQVRAGVPLAQVARQRSDGVTASEGGRREWTDQGSLVCEQLDRALFGLPLGGLSKILTSEHGYHIVRVIQREDVTRTPFLEAQVEIKQRIRNQRIQQQLRAYVSRLQEEVPVWPPNP